MTKELEIIRRAAESAVRRGHNHGCIQAFGRDPCDCYQSEISTILAAVERLEAERQRDTRLSIATEALERISRMVCFTVVANEPRKVGCKCFSCAARSALSQIRVLESPRTVEAIDAAIESTKESA